MTDELNESDLIWLAAPEFPLSARQSRFLKWSIE